LLWCFVSWGCRFICCSTLVSMSSNQLYILSSLPRRVDWHAYELILVPLRSRYIVKMYTCGDALGGKDISKTELSSPSTISPTRGWLSTMAHGMHTELTQRIHSVSMCPLLHALNDFINWTLYKGYEALSTLDAWVKKANQWAPDVMQRVSSLTSTLKQQFLSTLTFKKLGRRQICSVLLKR
jgi:hypothetical protein